MTPDMEEGRTIGPAPQEAVAAKRKARGDFTLTDAHEAHMFGIGRRIRWLEHHRHWWLRTEDARHQREFLDRRDAA
jgi:hypothetical protein